MKKRTTILALCLALLLCLPALSFAEFINQKTYGGSHGEYIYEAIALPDGGLLVLANSRSDDGDLTGRKNPSPVYDAWALRTDASGEIVWDIVLGDADTMDEFMSGVALPDGRFALLRKCFTDAQDDNESSELVIVSADGAVELTAALPARTLSLATDGESIYGTGWRATDSAPGSEFDFDYTSFVVRVDLTGAIQWEKDLEVPEVTRLQLEHIVPVEGGVIAAGRGYTEDRTALGMLVKMSGAGDTLWSRGLEGEDATYLEGLTAMPDGGAAAFGRRSFKKEGDDWYSGKGFATRVDAEGKTLWAKTFLRDDETEMKGIVPALDGEGVVIVSETNTSGDRQWPLLDNCWFLRLDGTGEIVEEAFISDIGADPTYLSGLLRGPDGRLIVYGAALKGDTLGYEDIFTAEVSLPAIAEMP